MVIVASRLCKMETSLSYTQEEAYGHLLLHAAHTVRQGYQNIVINSDDTDMLILLVAFHDIIRGNIYLKFGNKKFTMIISIQTVAATLGGDICK